MKRAVVFGGGIGGLTAGLALSRTGWDVTVVERAGSVEPVGSGLGLGPNAVRSLAELGWSLPHPPRTPTGAAWRLLGHRTVDPRWREWLGVPESVSA